MASSQPLFKDLGKSANDLLKKEFPYNEKKIEWKGTTVNDIVVETNFQQKGDGTVIGSIIPSYKYRLYGLTFLAELNTKKDVRLETTVENQGIEGLKLTLTGEAKQNETFGTFNAEFKSPMATANASFDFGKMLGSTLKASTVFGIPRFCFGLHGEYFFGKSDSTLRMFNVTLGHITKDFEATVFGRVDAVKTKNEIGGTFCHSINYSTKVATEIVFDTSHSDSRPNLIFGGQHKLHEDTIFKGKFDSNGIVGLSLIQKFNNSSKLVVGADIDTNNLSGKNSTSFGFSIFLSS
jgi:voltage-dependent anion channel protein 2